MTDLDGVRDTHICPECRDGKHRNCDGTAWCWLHDAATVCACANCPDNGIVTRSAAIPKGEHE